MDSSESVMVTLLSTFAHFRKATCSVGRQIQQRSSNRTSWEGGKRRITDLTRPELSAPPLEQVPRTKLTRRGCAQGLIRKGLELAAYPLPNLFDCWERSLSLHSSIENLDCLLTRPVISRTRKGSSLSYSKNDTPLSESVTPEPHWS